MTSFLIDHARMNVWCNPGLDNQLVFQPRKITPRIGSFNTFLLMGRPVTLPEPMKYYQVFQVGQLDPKHVGLFNRNPPWTAERWIPISEAVNTLNVEVTIYNQNGVVLPRYKTYFMFTKDKALLFALEIDKKFSVNWYEDRFYFRFYTNAYLKTGLGSHQENRMVNVGGEPSTTSSILYLQTEVQKYKNKPGVVRIYKNGLLVPDLNLFTIQENDRVEWVYDSSVKKTVEFKIGDLHSFLSKLDNSFKYLLHHQDLDTESIDYQDDIDIYVLTPVSFNRQLGVYFNRNHPSHHRMVTHRDYSIATEVFKELATSLAGMSEDPLADLRQFRVLMYVREGGYNRSLIHDHNRIFELYKLPEPEVVKALIGLNSTVPEWRSDNLEYSAYTKIMRAGYREITIQDVEQGYGYNSISKILADTPTKTETYSGIQRAKLPYLLQQNSTVYEFDAEGVMLGWRYHQDDNDYDASSLDCRLIEAIPGRGTQQIDVSYGKNTLELPLMFNYRVYLSRIVDGVHDRKWKDITHLRGVEYKVEGTTLTYIGNDRDHYLMVKTDKTFLAYDRSLMVHEGLMSFSIEEISDQGQGLVADYVDVPGAQLDIWLNGHALIKDLDYVVHFPVVHILSKKYLKYPLNTTEQQIHVRMIGFCDKDLNLLKDDEYGWVNHGALSNNGRFDVRDDKVLRIVVAGKTKHRDDLKFYEDSIAIGVTDELNGSPYQIKSMYISLRDFIASDSLELMQKSKEVDKRVSDYLTSRINTSGPKQNFAIPDKYPVVSPFFAHIIHLLRNGLMVVPQNKTLSDTDIITMCKPYEGLLKWDPVTEFNTPDLTYSYVIPHYYDTVQSMKLYEYRFLMRVVKLYSNGLIDLSPFVNYVLE